METPELSERSWREFFQTSLAARSVMHEHLREVDLD